MGLSFNINIVAELMLDNELTKRFCAAYLRGIVNCFALFVSFVLQILKRGSREKEKGILQKFKRLYNYIFLVTRCSLYLIN